MKYLILGAGLMGRAVAFDLLTNNDTTEIILADIDFKQASNVAKWLNDKRVIPLQLDVNNTIAVLEAMKGKNSAIGCISYAFNFDLSKAAIQSGVNFCDLGGNDIIAAKQFNLQKAAIKAGITIIPSCGLAPGVVNILVAAGVGRFDTLKGIHIRVGGLPKEPLPPLNYSLVFSVQGLTNEYIETARIIKEGKIIHVESLTGIEEIEFPDTLGLLEAFYTSGGASTLPNTFLGKVNELDYKTIRYKGHCDKVKAILDLGFRSDEEIDFKGCKISPRKFLELILERNLMLKNDKDITLVRIEIIGEIKSQKHRLIMQIIDNFDEKQCLTSMMRMTSFPVAIIARMMARGEIKKKGVIVQEFNVPAEKMIEELHKRNIIIEERIMPL